MPTEKSTDDSTRYLIVDCESVPDGRLLRMLKHPGEDVTDADAIDQARMDALAASANRSDFINVAFQIPVAICVLRVDSSFRLQRLSCLDAPNFDVATMVRQFWLGLSKIEGVTLVTYNGRSFDLPLLEMAAFRYGVSTGKYFANYRDRYRGQHLDLMEWFSNHGASRMAGGMNLLSKLLGKPGKMDVSGADVLEMWKANRKQEINDYCLCDTLDTYFVFLRTRVMAGILSLESEQSLVRDTQAWLEARVEEFPGLKKYLARWGEWAPWP